MTLSLLFVAGLVCIVVGIAMWSVPLALVVGGVSLMAGALLERAAAGRAEEQAEDGPRPAARPF